MAAAAAREACLGLIPEAVAEQDFEALAESVRLAVVAALALMEAAPEGLAVQLGQLPLTDPGAEAAGRQAHQLEAQGGILLMVAVEAAVVAASHLGMLIGLVVRGLEQLTL